MPMPSLTPEEKQSYCQKICSHWAFTAPKKKDIQRMLSLAVKAEIDETELNGRDLAKELKVKYNDYRHWPKTLTVALERYYADTSPAGGAEDEFRVQWIGNKTEIEWIPKPEFPRGVTDSGPASLPNKTTLPDELRTKIEQFWGHGASTRTDLAKIIIQADYIEKLVFPFVKDLDKRLRLKKNHDHRLLKARFWVNGFDVEGGLAVRDVFQAIHLGTPKLEFVPRSEYAFGEDAPFCVILGLGFTNATRTLEEIGANWLSVKPLRSGDGVSLHRERFLKKPPARLQMSKEEKPRSSLVRLLPKSWNLDRWRSLRQDADTEKIGPAKNVRDYAIIVRYTVPLTNGKKQIQFYAAGFSEHGTAIAGQWLAANWDSTLWNIFLKSRQSGGQGDFFILIEGPSNHDAVSFWEIDRGIKPIIPSRLRGIECEWSMRLPPRHQPSKRSSELEKQA